MSDEILSIAEASRLIQSKALSPVALTEQCLDRIRTYDGKLNAFLLVTEKEALAQAQQAEKEIAAGRSKGPLHGIPIAHKDIYSTKGIRTTAHSKVLADHVPTEDATTVRKLSQAGTLMLGKLATHEFAMGGPSFDLPWPPARNPWNYEHVTGGSSSGTGAAIAAGMTLGGTGSDTGGSIRNPSAWCGVSGIKPTYGLCSRAGVFPLSYSLDHTGPMAWTVEDCALLLQAMAGHDPRDPASASVPIPDYHSLLRTDLKGMRVGLIRHFHEQDTQIDPEMQKSLDAAIAVMRDLGATVTDVRLPPLSQFAACCYIILLTEAFVVHSTEFRTRFNDYCENFRDRAAIAALLSAPDYLQAQRLRRQLIDETRRATTDVDVLVTAALNGPAPTFAGSDKWAMFKRPPLPMPCNVTGQPVTTVCTGFHSSGLPLAIQVIGHPFQDATTLAVAHAYQVATPWRAKRPVLKAA